MATTGVVFAVVIAATLQPLLDLATLWYQKCKAAHSSLLQALQQQKHLNEVLTYSQQHMLWCTLTTANAGGLHDF